MNFLRKLRPLFRKEKLETEMAEEMRHHVELQTGLNLKSGMKPDDARFAALRQFGNVARIQEQAREQRGWVWVEQWGKDAMFAVRSLGRARGFTFTVLATLVLGIGVATAAFDLTSWILFRAQPYPQPEQLYLIGSKAPKESFLPVCYGVQLQAYQQGTKVFSGFAAANGGRANIVINGEPSVASVLSITVDSFRTLGIKPVLGRGFFPEEHNAGAGQVVVISDLFWREKFQAANDVLGRKLIINQQVCTVVGVLAAAQPLPDGFLNGDVYRPLTGNADPTLPFNQLFYATVGRLAAGVSPAQASAALATIRVTGLAVWAEPFFAQQQPALQKLTSLRRPNSYWLVFIAAAFLYAIACLNAMNLMLVRLLGRRRELSIRLALGGSRWRIVRLLLLESVTLTLAASAVVALAAWWLFPPLFALLENNPAVRFKDYWDGGTLDCIAALSVFAGVMIVLVPAWRLFRANLNASLKEGGPAQGESRRMANLRSGLVMLQAAFAMILLTGTGLMVRSFEQLRRVDLGFSPGNIIKVQVSPAPGYELEAAGRVELFGRLREKLISVLGVRGVAYGSDALLREGVFRMEQVLLADGTFHPAAGSYVSDNYLQTAGLTMLNGRWLVGGEGRREVVINERLARERFGERDPVGQLLNIKVKTEQTYEVVGVIRNVRETLHESVGLDVYFPVETTYNPGALNTLILRVDHPVSSAFGAMIRRKIYELEPRLIVDHVSSIAETIDESLWAERFAFTMLKGLAGIALGLAVVGLFAVIAHTVDSRTKEFGVRLALGAEPGDLHWLVMKRGVATAALGVGVGILGALGLTRFIQSLLFETTPNEPVVYLVVAALLLVAAAVACWLPARRAAKVDPVVALRAD